ncbi:hypothetical protein BaRGS_00021196, partial [Batillaria attramentaria]
SAKAANEFLSRGREFRKRSSRRTFIVGADQNALADGVSRWVHNEPVCTASCTLKNRKTGPCGLALAACRFIEVLIVIGEYRPRPAVPLSLVSESSGG